MLRSEMKLRRARRVRSRLRKVAEGHLRLSVYRSLNHIYAQIIDDTKGHTLVSASTLSNKDSAFKTGGNIAAASLVGKLIAEKAQKAGIIKVVFDRGPYVYHGRIKALAESAREGGLVF